MKYIECKLPVMVKIGEAEWEEKFLPARLSYNEDNEAYAAANAENGEYTVVEVNPEQPEETVDVVSTDDMAAAILEGVNDV